MAITGIGFYQNKALKLNQQIVIVLTKSSSGLWQKGKMTLKRIR
jgi:hypothetical protein